jgi:hypothetical protein
MVPATLRLEKRQTKRPDEGTHNFVVPVLDLEVTPTQLISGGLEQREVRAALTPVPQIESKPQTIAQQVSDAKAIESRKRTASMPSTGVKPRTVAQAKSDTTATVDAVTVDDPYADVPPPEAPSSEQIMKTVREVQATIGVLSQVEQAKQLLTDLVSLLDAKGFTDKQSKLAWCAAAIGRPLESAAHLHITELGALIAILNEDESPLDERLQQINAHYYTVSKTDMLSDITEFLQRLTPLKELTDLSDDEITSVLASLDNLKRENANADA